jgi:Tfp pilus assembly protein PilO
LFAGLLISQFFVKKYEMRGYGTFLQFMVFFEKIAENERLLNINEIKLERRAGGQRGRFQVIDAQVIVEAYRYNPSHKEDRGFKEAASAPAN